MKKQLFYNFYVTRDNFNGIINNIHYTCLEYYKHVFDEAFICITLDDTSDYELIKMTQNKFLEIFNGTLQKITFKITNNDPYLREVVFFYDEILEHLNDLDLVFFAHNKGLTNLNSPTVDNESLFYWLIALYYGSLHNYEEAILNMTSRLALTCGSCYTIHKSPKLADIYAGTFYWLNCKGIYRETRNNNIEIPKCSDRYIAEIFPHYINQCYSNTMSSTNDYHLEFEEENMCNWYLYTKQYCELCGYLNEEFYKLFNLAIKKEYI